MINDISKGITKSNTLIIPNLETIDDYNTTSPHLSHTEDESFNLRTKIDAQNSVINQFEYWINNLLKLVRFTKYSDYVDKIITRLDIIERLQTEREILRFILSEAYKDNLNLMKKIEESKGKIDQLKETVLSKDENELILQKHILIDSINYLSEELDYNAYKNTKYKETTECRKISDLSIELENLKKENAALKTEIKDKTMYPSKFGLGNKYIKFEYSSINDWNNTAESFISCCSVNSTRSEDSVTMELNYFKK